LHVATLAYAGDDPVNGSDPSGRINLPELAAWARSNATKPWKDGYVDDCTEFVSRALNEGGGALFNPGLAYPLDYKDPHYWYPSHSLFGIKVSPASLSWVRSNVLYQYLRLNESPVLGSVHLGLSGGCPCQDGPYQLPPGIQAGDIIFANFWSGDSSGIDHAGVILSVDKTDGNLEIGQHSHNVIEQLSDWQYLGANKGAPGSNTTVWIVQPQQLGGPIIA
jgi:hypothetical protein